MVQSSNGQSSRTYEIWDFLYFKGEKYQIIGINDPTLTIKDINTGEEVNIHKDELLTDDSIRAAKSLEELHRKITTNNKVALSPPIHAIPKKFLEKANTINYVVQEVSKSLAQKEAEDTGFRYTEGLKEAVAMIGISLATYYKYKKLYQKYSGDLNSIAASLHRSTYGKMKLKATQIHLIMTVLLKRSGLSTHDLFKLAESLLYRTGNRWLDPEKCKQPPENVVDDLLNTDIEISSILQNEDNRELFSPTKPIGRTAFFDFVKGFRAADSFGRKSFDDHFGEGSWDKNMKVFDTFVHLSTRPLQYVFADHHLLDVFMLDEATRSDAVRLWLTVLIDAYSRSVVGMSLLFEDPSIESIQEVIYDGLWPKSYISELGIEGDWLAYGIPEELSLDNAWAHQSISLENLIGLISQNGEYQKIAVRLRPPYMARYGALVERFFGSMSYKIRTWLKGYGAIQSSHRKDVGNAKAEAVLLYDDIRKFILTEIVAYQNRPPPRIKKYDPQREMVRGNGTPHSASSTPNS